jgi:hypothetical protein
MPGQVFRVTPNLPASEYRTYAIAAPRATHYRPASCAEARCAAHEHGWRSTVDERTDLGRAQARYVRLESGRRYTEHRDEGSGLTVFEFRPGQRCFSAHQVSLDRPPLYVVRDGDWRGNPRGTEPRVHARPEDWVEDFATHQDRLSRLIERG